jgi:DNA replication licensing factor MCM6
MLFFALIALQITTAFVREAYTLLRQSIIHVEQDDIDFDEEEAEGQAKAAPNAAVDGEDGTDVEMSAAEHEALDRIEESYNESIGFGASSSIGLPNGTPAPSASQARDRTPIPPPAQPQKRRMVITHDKYMTLRSLIVLHLAEVERQNGRGQEREELIDWYLELKESEVQDLEEIEYETELITKMLKRLVKVRTILDPAVLLDDFLFPG